MKVLTIKEPFATLIMNKVKYIETRSWKTNYRGEIYIHSGLAKLTKEVKERKGGIVWDDVALETIKNMSNSVLYKSILQTLDTYHQLTEPQKRGLEYFSKLQQQMESYNEFQKRIATIKDSMRGWEDFAETYRSQQFKGIDNKKEENKEE